MKLRQRAGALEIILAFVVVALLIGGAVGYVVISRKDKDSKNEQPQQSSDMARPEDVPECTPDIKDAFQKAPFDIDQVKVVTPGKETNDPRFVYPWVKTATTDRVNIYAPAEGRLYMIRHKVYEIDGKKGNDYDMFFAVDCKTVYRFNHISHPREDIKATYPAGDLPSGDYANGGVDIAERVKPKEAITVKAGESLGYTTGTPTARNFDFAVGISTSRESDKLAVCPFTVFKDPLKTQLLNLMGSKAGGVPIPGYACDVEAKKF